eukprot:scaffold1853_cov287-Chaetoceros_neogracile.AAC.18
MVLITVFISILYTVSGQESVDPSQEIQSRYQCNGLELSQHPHHCHLMDLAAQDPQQFAADLHRWSRDIGLALPDYTIATWEQIRSDEEAAFANVPREEEDLTIPAKPMDARGQHLTTIKRNLRTDPNRNPKRDPSASLPSVTAHGMGDSCFNEGSMQYITDRVADLTHQYATCIPTGDNHHDDVLNGYFMSMNENIDIFAQKVKADPKLSNGFNAVGFSQGNNVLRGYIAKYNDPPVHTFLSINGVNAGISAVPYCIPSMSTNNTFRNETVADSRLSPNPRLHNKICDALMEVASHRAYSEFSQTHSFQANYWRDPRRVEKLDYQTYSQLAELGNEGLDQNEVLNDNFAKTQKFVWVLATEDTIVWPKEGEQWGAPNSEAEDPFVDILPMKDTEWYQKDLFGLKTADEAGKFHYEEFAGDHLRFEFTDFDVWIRKYFLED